MTTRDQILAAIAAGMPRASAVRWPRYLALKATEGLSPITLDEAVAQCRAARKATR